MVIYGTAPQYQKIQRQLVASWKDDYAIAVCGSTGPQYGNMWQTEEMTRSCRSGSGLDSISLFCDCGLHEVRNVEYK